MKRLWHWLRYPEIIGAKDCPIIRRWTLIDSKPATVSPSSNQTEQTGDLRFFRQDGVARVFPLFELPSWLTRDRKLMIHRFMPNVEDRDPHDHPRGFWTFVLWGSYFDLVPCGFCKGVGSVIDPNGLRGIAGIPENGEYPPLRPRVRCWECDGEGLVVGDRMKAGTFRFRPATHQHVTQSSARGAWTIVLMTPLQRPWGFWREGKWWAWKDYEEEFGFSMRCPSDEEREGRMMKYADDGEVVYKAAPVGVSTMHYADAAFDVKPRSSKTSLTLQEAREQDRRRQTERKDGR